MQLSPSLSLSVTPRQNIYNILVTVERFLIKIVALYDLFILAGFEFISSFIDSLFPLSSFETTQTTNELY